MMIELQFITSEMMIYIIVLKYERFALQSFKKSTKILCIEFHINVNEYNSKNV